LELEKRGWPSELTFGGRADAVTLATEAAVTFSTSASSADIGACRFSCSEKVMVVRVSTLRPNYRVVWYFTALRSYAAHNRFPAA
jgi:hypothetical protein